MRPDQGTGPAPRQGAPAAGPGAGVVLAQHRAVAGIHLAPQHAIAPEVGELLEHGPRLLRVEHLLAQHAMEQH
jgi:hypothetical protein